MDRIPLREYQRSLSARLMGETGGQSVSKLGLQAGSQRWLIELADAREVIPLPPVFPLPRTRPWVAGLTNIRGSLHVAIDFSAFLGTAPAVRAEDCRLLLIAEKYRVNCGLIVDRVHGLYREEQLARTGGAVIPAWSAANYVDEAGNVWEQLNVASLTAHADFLTVAA